MILAVMHAAVQPGCDAACHNEPHVAMVTLVTTLVQHKDESEMMPAPGAVCPRCIMTCFLKCTGLWFSGLPRHRTPL
jgi:hypothetical protein